MMEVRDDTTRTTGCDGTAVVRGGEGGQTGTEGFGAGAVEAERDCGSELGVYRALTEIDDPSEMAKVIVRLTEEIRRVVGQGRG